MKHLPKRLLLQYSTKFNFTNFILQKKNDPKNEASNYKRRFSS
jgi:hypothetical protein